MVALRMCPPPPPIYHLTQPKTPWLKIGSPRSSERHIKTLLLSCILMAYFLINLQTLILSLYYSCICVDTHFMTTYMEQSPS